MKNKLDKLLASKAKMEKTKTYQKWVRYQSLSEWQKEALEKAWDEYYTKVKETQSYGLFQKTLEGMRTNNKQMILEAAQEAKELRLRGGDHTLQEPSTIDPRFLIMRFGKPYESLLREIQSAQNEGAGEVDEIFQ